MDNEATDEVGRLILDLRDDRRDVRSRAAYELGKHIDPRTVAPLIAALSDPDKFVRSWAAGALGKAGEPAVDPLLEVISGTDPIVRFYAALALGDIGDVRAVPALVQALREGDYDIHPSAAGVLASLGDAEALPDRILIDPNLTNTQRIEALNALFGVTYSDDEVHIQYPKLSPEELCKKRTQAAIEPVRSAAADTLVAIQEQARSRSVDMAADFGPAIQPQEPQNSAPVLPAGQTLPPDAPVRMPAAEQPRRSLWARLVGRHGGEGGS